MIILFLVSAEEKETLKQDKTKSTDTSGKTKRGAKVTETKAEQKVHTPAEHRRTREHLEAKTLEIKQVLCEGWAR
jgi:hypothetical protein